MLIKGRADDLRRQAERSAKETRITGSGPLVDRVNKREEDRTAAIQGQIKVLDDAAATLTAAANQLGDDQKFWDARENARKNSPDAK